MAPRLATDHDVEDLSLSLARAFYDDPVLEFLFPDAGRRLDRCRRFFAFEARHIRSRGRVYTNRDQSGAALWAEPKRWRTPPGELLAGAPMMLRLFGRRIPAAMRMLSHIERVHPRAPHWYLAVLGTDPDKQGRGIGSALMGPVLEECDDDGVGAYLESSKESNVPFYRRHGFEVTEVISGPGLPTLWGMWRDPR